MRLASRTEICDSPCESASLKAIYALAVGLYH